MDCKQCFACVKYEHDYTEQTMYNCFIANKGVGNYDEIPQWCPLREEDENETDMETSINMGR